MLKKTIGLLLLMALFTTALAHTVYVRDNYYGYPPQPQPTYYYDNNRGAIVYTGVVVGTTGYLIGRGVYNDRYYNNYYKHKYYRQCHRAWNGRVYCHHGYRYRY